jgi:carboxyl-terminal processing protease
VILRGEERLPFTLTRERIVVRAVQGVSRGPDGAWDFMLDHERKIGYIRLAQFIPSAPDEMAEALESMGAPAGGLNGLVLDLRNNPGGDLDACLEIADMVLRQGTIVSVRGRTGPDQSYASNPSGTLPDFPLVVLVNGFSASASEIVAGSLADHGRATIIGTRTFGKGLVQTVRHLRSIPDAYVKYTIQRYELPSGRVIQRTDDSTTWGVDPTPGFYIPMTDEEQIAALTKRRELDILRNGNTPPASANPAPEPRWADPEWIESDLKDKQLAAAVRAMDARLASGVWKPLSDETQQAVRVSADELRSLDRMHQRMLRAVAEVEKRMTTLESEIAGGTPSTTEADLWPDDLDLVNGAIEVFDREHRKVADLKITGPELERWLLLADVEPVGASAEPVPAAADPEKQP